MTPGDFFVEETLLELLQIQRSSGLTAPIDGTVYSVAELDTADDTTVTDIVTLSPDVSMSVTINVDESDILSLSVGQTATVTVRSVGDDTISGVVTEVDRTASSGSYTAVVTMDKVQGMLPGMTANVKVRIEGVDDALLIPVDALHQTSAGYYVYTSYDEETQTYGGKVDVVPGLQDSTSVEIRSGLTDGDVVYYTKKQSFSDMFSFSMMPGGGSSSQGSGGRPSFGGQGGSGSQGSSKFTVELTLMKDGDMLPNMNASAAITLETIQDALCIPAAALTEADGKTVVYTALDEKTGSPCSPVEVIIGAADADLVQILSGLQESDPVYYAYYEAAGQ